MGRGFDLPQSLEKIVFNFSIICPSIITMDTIKVKVCITQFRHFSVPVAIIFTQHISAYLNIPKIFCCFKPNFQAQATTSLKFRGVQTWDFGLEPSLVSFSLLHFQNCIKILLLEQKHIHMCIRVCVCKKSLLHCMCFFLRNWCQISIHSCILLGLSVNLFLSFFSLIFSYSG